MANVTVTIPDDLLVRVDKAAEVAIRNRSNMFTVLLSEALDLREATRKAATA